MPGPHKPASVLRVPRRTLRMQLTLLYAGPFFASGAALLTIPLLQTRNTVPASSQGGPGPSAPGAPTSTSTTCSPPPLSASRSWSWSHSCSAG